MRLVAVDGDYHALRVLEVLVLQVKYVSLMPLVRLLPKYVQEKGVIMDVAREGNV